MSKASPYRGGEEYEPSDITRGYTLLVDPFTPTDTTLGSKSPSINHNFPDGSDRRRSWVSSVFRNFSTASRGSNLLTHSWRRPATYNIADLSSYIASTPLTRITRLKWCKDRHGLRHEFLLLEVERPEDGGTLWLRLERRLHENASILKSISSPVPSGDSAKICNDVSRLFETAHSQVQVETEFSVPPLLQRLGNLLSSLRENSPDYKLSSENCYFFCAAIYENLFSMGKGVDVAGAPSKLSLRFAPEAKAKIKKYMDMWLSSEPPIIPSLPPQNPLPTEWMAFPTPLSIEPRPNEILVSQQPEETIAKDPFIYSDDDWLATYAQPSPQSPLQPQQHPSTPLQPPHPSEIVSPSSPDEPQSPYGLWFPSNHNSPNLNGLKATHSPINEHINPAPYTPLLDSSVVRPGPMHPSHHPGPIQPMSMPPPASLAHNHPFQNHSMHVRHVSNSLEPSRAPSDEGKMSISIDFGTTFSGVAYGSTRIASGKVQQILSWPGASENFRKIPTCVVYDDAGRVRAWGLEAKNLGPMPGTTRCEWFKLFLDPMALRDGKAIDPRLPKLPPGKRAIDLIIDFLACLWDYAKEQITREIGAVADLNVADVWLTVPAAWDARGCQIMRNAALSAGLVGSAHANDRDWRDRLHIITEPEAAAVHCAHLTNLHQLRPSQNFMICDAGGGTVDLAVYKITGSLTSLEIAEVCARSGSNCGSLFLDLRFRELVRTLLADHPAHLDATSLAHFMHSFSETDKLAYMGESDDSNMFRFTCFNPEDPDDPFAGLVDGELEIPGSLLRRDVFDPVVEQVLQLIEEQIQRAGQRIDALLLVGGFSGSEYLFKRVDETFSSRIKVIARPPDADTATCRGAAQYGLARRPLVSLIVAPKSYIMRVKLPVELEDWQKRPAYIKKNDAGHSVCENRLQYLVSKGAILRKGQRVKTKFCKFSATPQDRTFVAVIYTSDSDKIMRYTDEGETFELCRWTADLGSLPGFQRDASNPPLENFYTEFELGLEFDSAEVRGVLLYGGYECGKVTFDFLI